MTVMMIAMFLLGLSLGLGYSALVANSMLKREMKALENMANFLKKFVDISEESENHYHDAVNSVKERQMKMLTIMDELLENEKNFSRDITTALTSDHNNHREILSTFCEKNDSFMQLEDERWNLICDYITNENGRKKCIGYLK